MGCGSSTDVVKNTIYKQEEVLSSENSIPNSRSSPLHDNNNTKSALRQPLAFEVPINDEEKSIIKRHPPIRFQRLEEQQLPQPEVTLELLQKRQAEAEIRRRRILLTRVQSAQQFQQKIRTTS
ncbi:uncharacterized protein CCDC198-like [Leptopilina boulardi]|uniref:uncharacterized protein CCDC198-like n=1 Tax=Leptopilina boulardi TaxID=63433 RepID=UPI0021F51F7E|nr:uncharacterized protein CCDC198-like [Leptopilina boulardi]